MFQIVAACFFIDVFKHKKWNTFFRNVFINYNSIFWGSFNLNRGKFWTIFSNSIVEIDIWPFLGVNHFSKQHNIIPPATLVPKFNVTRVPVQTCVCAACACLKYPWRIISTSKDFSSNHLLVQRRQSVAQRQSLEDDDKKIMNN